MKVLFNPIYNGGNAPKKIEEVGGNTGNLVFVQAIKDNFEFDEEAYFDCQWTREYGGGVDVVSIMPASNFLSRSTAWLEYMIPILEQTDMRFTFVGLGAQAALGERPKDVIDKLTDKQRYVFKLVSERARTIGVRGEFTAECLEEMGIHNVDIIGCPSFFMYEGEYPVLPKPSREKILYTIQTGKKFEVIRHMMEHENARLICQVPSDAAKERQNIFFDIADWNTYIQKEKFTFAFGCRFHGNMMALRNKIPTLWLAHDWRTLELVRYLGVPYLEYRDDKLTEEITSVEQLIEYCDYENVYKRYPQIYKHYCEFMNLNFTD